MKTNQKRLFTLVFLTAAISAYSQQYPLPAPMPGPDAVAIYASPDGDDGNTGSITSPVTIHEAVRRVNAGEVIYLRGGVYYLTETLHIDKVGTEEKPYRLFAYGDENPVLDGSRLPQDAKLGKGICLGRGTYWHIRKIEIRKCYHNGLYIIDGNSNLIDQCVSHHNGIDGFVVGYGHLEEGKPAANPNLDKCSFNTFLNCDSYNNFDWYSINQGRRPGLRPGTNSDGFNIKGQGGRGMRYIGCRSWSNSDDGYDFLECGAAVQVINCYAIRSGQWEDHVERYFEMTGKELTDELFDGDGNGFKLGGGGLNSPDKYCDLESMGTHIVRNSIAMDCARTGFDQNNHRYGAWVENCLGFGNKTNFRYWKPNVDGTSWKFRNNISFGGIQPDEFNGITISIDESNSWNLGLEGDASQFVSLSFEDATAPRNADGSLPCCFGHLTKKSIFIDKGMSTEFVAGDTFEYDPIPYKSQAPDLGAYEYGN